MSHIKKRQQCEVPKPEKDKANLPSNTMREKKKPLEKRT
jgi:hypothetical protein